MERLRRDKNSSRHELAVYSAELEPMVRRWFQIDIPSRFDACNQLSGRNSAKGTRGWRFNGIACSFAGRQIGCLRCVRAAPYEGPSRSAILGKNDDTCDFGDGGIETTGYHREKPR